VDKRSQEAINNASDGDTILVYSGVYHENVVVDKSVTLRGIGYPVVDANGSGNAIALTADGITLQGFNATKGSWEGAGITISSSNNTITGNTVCHNNKDGIDLLSSSNTTITDNNISDNICGIFLLHSSNTNTITGNNVSNNNGSGIILWYSSNNNTITGNNVCNNYYDGIGLFYSNNNTITSNIALNNRNGGIRLSSSNSNKISDNTASDNNGSGISLFVSINNKIYLNNFCNNSVYDIWDAGSNSGDENTCDLTSNWNDAGTNGCTYPCPIEKLDIYFADAKEPPGSVYHYDTTTGIEGTIYTRPSRRLYTFTFHPRIPEKLYYVNANEDNIYRTHQTGLGWAPEEVVYTHDTYVRDLAFAFDKAGNLGLYFSESRGAGGNGKIYKIEDSTASLFYEVKLADVGGFWAGNFAFDDKGNLYLSSGNRIPASIYKVEDGKVKEIFKDERESIKGFTYKDGSLYYANWRTKIYQLDLSTGRRTNIYTNLAHSWLSDVDFRPDGNLKNMEKYGEREIFLISDEEWKDVLRIVSLSTWTEHREVKKYPTLIYHNENNGFDADSIIYFMQQYDPDHLTIVGGTPPELDDLLIADPPLGAGLELNDIERISIDDYFSYWSHYRDVVYVEENYELALLASTYASLINAPLVIEGTPYGNALYDRHIICVGDTCPPGYSCDETYDLEEMQQKYISLTDTDRIILVNPNDLNIKVNEDFQPEKSANTINEIYSKTSLAAPILASAKHELIIGINLTGIKCDPYSGDDNKDFIAADSFVEQKISTLFGRASREEESSLKRNLIEKVRSFNKDEIMRTSKTYIPEQRAINGKNLVRVQLTAQGIEDIPLDLDIASVAKNYVDIVANQSEIAMIQGRGFTVEILPVNTFDLFRRGGEGLNYHNYSDMVELENIESNHPDIAKLFYIGNSVEGRHILAMKISDNVQQEEVDEPEILIVGNHHAREIMTVEVPIYLINYLTDNYVTNHEIKNYIDNTEIWVVPMMNPDGHVRVEEGNIWWRKNARDNGDGTFGVDLNRNYGYMWGYDDAGSSPHTHSQTYRGTAAFSEPETQAIRDLENTHNFNFTISYHSYGGQLFIPWAYIAQNTPDHNRFYNLATNMLNGLSDYYYVSSTSMGDYPCNGEMNDYDYGETTTKNKIFGFTFELNNLEEGGFMPPAEMIEPTATEHLLPFFHLLDQLVEGEEGTRRAKYLTIVASPKAIQYWGDCGNIGKGSADWKYGSLDNTNPLLHVGRIYSITTSDVSSYMARAIFYDELLNNIYEVNEYTGMSIAAPNFAQDQINAQEIKNKTSASGYDTICFTWHGSSAQPACDAYINIQSEDYQNKQFVSFADHGSSTLWGGTLSSSEIPWLDIPYTFSLACLTNNFWGGKGLTFGPTWIRKGGISYHASIPGTNGYYWELWAIQDLTGENRLSLGEISTNLINRPDYTYEVKRHYTMLGDPTLIPKSKEVTWE
jgi:parallel beta-helix repeat protein